MPGRAAQPRFDLPQEPVLSTRALRVCAVAFLPPILPDENSSLVDAEVIDDCFHPVGLPPSQRARRPARGRRTFGGPCFPSRACPCGAPPALAVWPRRRAFPSPGRLQRPRAALPHPSEPVCSGARGWLRARAGGRPPLAFCPSGSSARIPGRTRGLVRPWSHAGGFSVPQTPGVGVRSVPNPAPACRAASCRRRTCRRPQTCGRAASTRMHPRVVQPAAYCHCLGKALPT